MADYTITIPDLRTYLATLKPGDNAGLTANMRGCLVTRALEHKYPEKKFTVNNTTFTTLELAEPWHPLAGEVADIVEQFDELRVGSEWVSRQEVEEAIPQLKGE